MSAAVGIGGRYESVEKIVRNFVIKSLAESFLLPLDWPLFPPALLLLLLLFPLLLLLLPELPEFPPFDDGFLIIEISLPKLPSAWACCISICEYSGDFIRSANLPWSNLLVKSA